MNVLPSIDVWGGRLARFTPEGPRTVDLFDGDPLRAADAFVAAGASWLHVVDMDLAYSGEMSIGSLVGNLAPRGIQIEVSGGITRADDVEAFLSSGAHRVILGSAALVDRVSVAGVVDRFAAAVAVAVEAGGDLIRPRGAPEIQLGLWDTLEWLRRLDVSHLVATAVASVGERGGPDLDLVDVCLRTGIPVIASGGIATLEDLETLADAGVDGAIVGSAVLDGSLDLKLALARFS